MFLLPFAEKNKLLFNNSSSVFIEIRCVLGIVLNIWLCYFILYSSAVKQVLMFLFFY